MADITAARKTSIPDVSEYCAVMDLGSNSFHLLVARSLSDGWITEERLKQKVQLMSGFADGRLSPVAMDRGLACLAAFGQRVDALDRSRIRVMGTCALREAGNRKTFIDRAEACLGVPVQVISGDEEARLINLGVAESLPPTNDLRRVVDIGGGSTEFARSGGGDLDTASLTLGCVAFTDAFFSHDLPIAAAYDNARAHAVAHLEAADLAPAASDEQVIGTSGTIESILTVLEANGWSQGHIHSDGLRQIEAAFRDRRWFLDTGFPGLPPERVDIFPAGMAILSAIFEVLGLVRMDYVDASLQDGMLLEMVGGRREGVSLQDATIEQLQRRFDVEADQAQRVEQAAAALFQGVRGTWWPGLPEAESLLRWAARLHEVGKTIDAAQYHRHGAYLIKSHEMRGFSAMQQRQLALLVRGHRRSFPGLAFRAFADEVGQALKRLIAVLRVAVILNRSRSDAHVPALSATAEGERLTVMLPQGWLDGHALSRIELATEAEQLARAGIELVVRET